MQVQDQSRAGRPRPEPPRPVGAAVRATCGERLVVLEHVRVARGGLARRESLAAGHGLVVAVTGRGREPAFLELSASDALRVGMSLLAASEPGR